MTLALLVWFAICRWPIMGRPVGNSEIERIIGRSAMDALIGQFGGQRLSIPAVVPAAIKRFIRNYGNLIGEDNALLLVTELGGGRYPIPTGSGHGGCHEALDVERVVGLTVQDKLTAAQIAHVMKCEPRAVHRARAKGKELGLYDKFRKRK